MFGRRRDHEDYVGGYDPEHEMPDPERGRGGPYQFHPGSSSGRYEDGWNREARGGRNLPEMDDNDPTPMTWNSNMGRSSGSDRWDRERQDSDYGREERTQESDPYQAGDRDE